MICKIYAEYLEHCRTACYYQSQKFPGLYPINALGQASGSNLKLVVVQ